jgi:transcriptional regulator with XRE-family HTH domain
MRYSDENVRGVLRQAISESSLRSVAKKIGVTPSFLSQVMRGNAPPSDKLAAFAGFHADGLKWVKVKAGKPLR